MKKEYIIPIFVSHLGCPELCVFCNQKKISGQETDIKPNDVRERIEFYLKNFKDSSKYVEVAFFGGSFTSISENIQNQLLEVAYEYIKSGKVNSIRISTRPDSIDKKTLKRLKKYGVKTIELGVQSSNDYILRISKRGHNFEDVKKAAKLIRWYGFNLGVQMMVGLPESTLIDETKTAFDLIKLRPKMVRIYPVLVIKGTQLERSYLNGEYEPLKVEQAVERSKQVAYLFIRKNVEIIRIGLQTTEEITYPTEEGSDVVAGPFHPAFRQLVDSEMWYDSIAERIKNINSKVKSIEITVNPRDINDAIGHKRVNVLRFKDMYNIDTFIKCDEKIKIGKFDIKVLENFGN